MPITTSEALSLSSLDEVELIPPEDEPVHDEQIMNITIDLFLLYTKLFVVCIEQHNLLWFFKPAVI